MEHDERMMYQLYFRFIQFSLGLYDGNEFLSGKALECFDWETFYRFAKKQALTGVVFEGIQRLPKKCAPNQDLLMTWFGQSQRIHKRNILLNETTAHIYNKVRAAGLRCCILKGQGNALMYPNPHSRTPGDVDVWVNASREEIRRLAKRLVEDNGAIGEESLNHIEMTIDGVAAELHSTPAIMNNPVYNRHLQKWLRRNADLQCSNVVSLPDDAGDVAIPTCTFNVIYQLFHLYHHYFYEGVGLRQIIDYYFALTMLSVECEMLNGKRNEKQNNKQSIQHSTLNIQHSLQHSLKHLGLWKFAGAVMYVLHEVLGLSVDKMIAPMDVKRGRLLLNEILKGGNFGQYDERYSFGKGTLGHNMQRLYRDIRLVRYYPAEALSEPIFRTWHFFWRLKKKV